MPILLVPFESYDYERFLQMSLRKQLQRLVDEKGVSIAKLGRIADVHDETIFNFLKGKSEMTAENLDKCFKVLRSLPVPADAQPSSGDEQSTRTG
jgi:predicted transcriptional regulator